MKALVYNGPGKIAVEDRPEPKVEHPADAVLKLVRTTICGSDLHIIKGDVPFVPAGRILGHEGIGIIQDVGSEVKNFKKGQKVLISCITSCAVCTFCKRNLQAHCENDGGWRLGGLNDGTQAEFVRIMHADASLHPIPPGADERQLLLFSDILPTGLEIGVLRGGVKPGCTVAIIGAGPVGLAALLSAQLYSPSALVMIDRDEKRLKVAKDLGATDTVQVDDKMDIRKATEKHFGVIDGFDVVIEAVGVPATFQMCSDLVSKGGSIANIGVHGSKVDLHLETLWIRSIKLTTGLVDANTTPMLLKLFQAKKLNVERFITHDFKFSEIMKAYDVFSNAADTGALKVHIEY